MRKINESLKVIGVIPARYGSSRFEGKVLADILGKPMIQWVWQRASQCKLLEKLIIACDDERIREVAESFGAEVVMTAKAHASGTDRIAEVVNPLDVKVVVNIQADEPLIHPTMIDTVAGAILNNPDVVCATVMKRITEPDQINDPNVVKVIVDINGFALYFSRLAIPALAYNSEEKNLFYFKHIGLYAYTKDFLFTYKNMKPSYLERVEKLEQLRILENGYRIKVIETKYDTIGVDKPEDIEKVIKYLKQNQQP
ncbi:MAG: 3-deoxy-manno-octulosonate cytidylyltransferase [Candidatus Omnitrophica bacterium]|nr:3-deoxy-manno-octulosonate cytidylyltransferase [Candidatus Omnitrophota bacterium]